MLADLLSKTDFMEKAGTGITRVKNACAINNNEVIFDFTDSFWVVIKTNKKENFSEKRINMILKLMNDNNRISTTEVARKLGVTRRTIASDIKILKSRGLLRRIGPDKGGKWEI